MIKRIDELLKSIAPLEYLKRPNIFPSLTYQIFANDDEYADEELQEIDYLVQIDIWVKSGDKVDKLDELSKQIREILWENDFTGYYESDIYEKDTQIWHRILKFNFLESYDREVI